MAGQGYAFEIRWDAPVGRHGACMQPVTKDEELILEWQSRTAPDASVTLEAVCRAVAKAISRSVSLLEKGLSHEHPPPGTALREVVLPELEGSPGTVSSSGPIRASNAEISAAIDEGLAPFSRLQRPQGSLGEWAKQYRVEARSLISLPTAGLEEDPFLTLLSDSTIDAIIGSLALNAVTIDLPYHPSARGSGLYILTANLNHACDPTARVDMEPGTVDIIVRANRDVQAGEEITLSYCPKGLTLSQRRQRLSKYEFECRCSMCIAEAGGVEEGEAVRKMSSEADALPADLPSLKELLKALVKQRTELEQELKFNIDALKSTPAGLDEALIDRDGFPRADCDLFAVTRSRGRVACLRNDLKDLMKRAETIMHAIHKAAAMQPDDVASALPTSASLGDACESTQPAAHVDAAKDTVDPLVARYTAYDPFLTVSSVLPTSPAEEAGLLKDDFIVAWSGVTKQHPDAMAMISLLQPPAPASESSHFGRVWSRSS
eukprot:gene11671-17995_t